MPKILSFTLIVALFFSCATQPTPKTLQESFDEIHMDTGYSGGILVAKEGEVVLQSSYGFSGALDPMPLDLDTPFRAGSVTKTFTAAAIMHLVEKGSLSVSETIDQYLSDFPRGEEITIEHLLTHTAGIKDVNSDDIMTEEEYATYLAPEDLISRFKEFPLAFDPGQDFLYSNFGYMVLGYLIEVVSGNSYEDYVMENIITPAGLNHTGFDYWDDSLGNVVIGILNTGEQAYPYDNYSHYYSAGALVTTLPDLHLWYQAFFDGIILSPETVESMTSAKVATNMHSAPDANYGYGFFVGEVNSSGIPSPVIGHGGLLPGFLTMTQYYPDEDIFIFLYSNNDGVYGARGFPQTILSHLEFSE